MRTNTAYSEFDKKSLQMCGIVNNDTLAIEDLSFDYMDYPTCLIRILKSCIFPQSLAEAIALLCHSMLLDLNFICTFETPNAVKGFAAPRHGTIANIQN